jgi:hypothetical protein
LAAARKFAREKFALRHRYAMVLHTDRLHPHVHVVVKAEGEESRRLHIDKAMLRAWREDFARLMREQGIAANATPRVIKTRDAIYRARQRSASNVVRERVTDIAKQLMLTGSFHDPAGHSLLETRKTVVRGWLEIADALDVQGDVVLAATCAISHAICRTYQQTESSSQRVTHPPRAALAQKTRVRSYANEEGGIHTLARTIISLTADASDQHSPEARLIRRICECEGGITVRFSTDSRRTSCYILLYICVTECTMMSSDDSNIREPIQPPCRFYWHRPDPRQGGELCGQVPRKCETDSISKVAPISKPV